MKIKIVYIFLFILLISSSSSLALIKNLSVEQQLENNFFNTTNQKILLGNPFMKTFGGVEDDYGWCCQQTSEGGFIITGITYNFETEDYDVWLIKTDNTGNMMWDKTFGKTDDDVGISVQQTTEGGYIITGGTYNSVALDYDVWLIKTDNTGNMMWDKTFGGEEDEVGYWIQQTFDDGYIIAGYTLSSGAGKSDVWLIKTDINGNITWDKTFGSTDDEGAVCVQQTFEGGYIITGYTFSIVAGDYDGWLIKTDTNGNMIWDKNFGGTDFDTSRCVRQTSDNGFILTGGTSSYGAGENDVWLIKTDNSGNMMWDKTFGGDLSDWSECVSQTTDGGYIITGGTSSYGAGENDVWLIKTDNSGNEMWNKTFGGTDFDRGNFIQQTTDGGYIITGGTSSFGAGGSDVWLIKTDIDGRSRFKLIKHPLINYLINRLNLFPLLKKLK